jgi:hypothetical protein
MLSSLSVHKIDVSLFLNSIFVPNGGKVSSTSKSESPSVHGNGFVE